MKFLCTTLHGWRSAYLRVLRGISEKQLLYTTSRTAGHWAKTVLLKQVFTGCLPDYFQRLPSFWTRASRSDNILGQQPLKAYITEGILMNSLKRQLGVLSSAQRKARHSFQMLNASLPQPVSPRCIVTLTFP